MDLADNLKRLRTDAGLTQSELAKKVGVTRATVTQWETGWSQPRMGAVERLAEAFGVSISELVDSRTKGIGFVDVPLLGSIAAGKPIDMMESDERFPAPLPIVERHPRSFFLRVEGDSVNRRIPDGYVALIDPDEREPNERDIFAVCVNGYSATLKHVRKLANGYELVPDSYDPTQRPIVFDYGEEGTDEVTIIGKVIWAAVPFDIDL